MNILVLDTNFVALHVLDMFQSAIWTDRYSTYGDFEICCNAEKELIDILQKDRYLICNESEHVMIIEDIQIEQDAEGGDKLTVTGRSLESILDRRIIWGQNTYQGNLQEAVKAMLTEAFIAPSKLPGRKVDNFVFIPSTDPIITNLLINAQYTGDNLYDVISNICIENSIGYKITLTSDNKFAFQLYAGVDRSYDQTENPCVVFSPQFDNLLNSNFFYSSKELKNVALIAGEGEGPTRTTTSLGTTTGLARREIFTDAGDVSSEKDEEMGGGTYTPEEYTKLLQTRGLSELLENKEKTAFEGQADAYIMYQYGKDYFIGDIVQMGDSYGHDAPAHITEVIISQSESDFSICPTFEMISKEGVIV